MAGRRITGAGTAGPPGPPGPPGPAGTLSGNTPNAVGVTGSAGVDVEGSASDHVHAHGNMVAASALYHALAQPTAGGNTPGFLSAADKTKIDQFIPTSAKTLAVTESLTLAASTAGKTLTLTNNASVEGTNTGDQSLAAYALKGANTDITSLVLNQTGLTIKGASANALTIKPNETLSGAKTLNLILGDTNRTITLTGDTSLSGTNTGDQTAIPNATLASMAANTVKVNATSSAATPTDLALTASTMLGRKSTGDIVALAASDVSTILSLGTAATTAATDYATSAQGTTANNALPKAGGTMTGTITMSNSGTIAMGASKITGMAAGTAATDATNAAQSAPAIVHFGDSNITGVTNGQVVYWTPWYGQSLGPSTTQSTLLMPFAGKLGPLYVYVATANAASAYTFSVCQNSTTPSSLACTVNAAANTGSDTNAAHYITVAAGDRISIQSTAPGTAQTMFGVQIALSLTVA